MADMDKFCSLCNKDISREKHIKDREGELFCNACHDMKRKVQAAQREKAAAAGNVPVASIAPVVQVAPIAPAPAPAVQDAPETEAPVERHGSWTPSFVILGLSCIIMAALQMLLPKGDAVTFGQALGAGVIHAVFVALGAILLLVTMNIAFRITGGSIHGSIEKVMAKALGLVLAISVVDFFTDRNETFWMVLYGFRGLLLLITLIALFDLDFFDTMILSLVNMVMGWGLAFGLGAALALLVNISHTPSHSYDTPTQQAMPGDPDMDVHWDK